MKRELYIYALLTLILSAKYVFAVVPAYKTPEIPDFSHYQSILNRMPFGAPPPDPGTIINPADAKTAAQEQKEQQMLARKLNMSCVNITPSGTPAVGFTDLSAKPAVNFYLLVGASAGGWTLKSADYTEEWAELEKDGTTIFVKLGQGLMAEPPKKKEVAINKAKSGAKKGSRVSPSGEEITEEEKPPPPSIEEQYVSLKAYELTGGPPAPGYAVRTELTKEEQLERQKVIQSALKERNNSGALSSYTDRLLQKQIEKEKMREAEEKIQREELENIAIEVAKETIELKLHEAEQLAIEGEL